MNFEREVQSWTLWRNKRVADPIPRVIRYGNWVCFVLATGGAFWEWAGTMKVKHEERQQKA